MEAIPLGRVKNEQINSKYSGAALKLGFYLDPPTYEVKLEEFELFAIERLRVLKDIENIGIRGLSGAAYINRMGELLNGFPLNTLEGQRKDRISHFTLRFAYCNPDDRHWFVRQETDMFRYRLDRMGIDNFLKQNKLNFETISEEEFRRFHTQLKELTESLGADKKKSTPKGLFPTQPKDLGASDFYKVEFEQALELVKNRKGFLHKGYIYLHTRNLITIITTRFKQSLIAGLEAAYKAFPHIKNDERVGPLIEKLPKQYIGKDWSKEAVGKAVSPGDLDMLSKRSFPLCMRVMHEKLRKNHHLKNTARMHYGLFLKGIGLSLDDALLFWRGEFTRKMPAEKFDKEYAYHIRHSYGKEGKKANYTPYSCVKIINHLPNHDEDHGCPFRYFNKDSLVNTLSAYGCSGSQIEEVLVEVNEKRWGHACRLYFQAKHVGYNLTDLVINHPQQYYTHSERAYNGEQPPPPQQQQQGGQSGQ